jgi:hypothetical protein
MNRTMFLASMTLVAIVALVSANVADVFAGPIAVGASSLIGTLDYSDTFTIKGARNNLSKFEDYGVGSLPLAVENAYGNPLIHWSESNAWSAPGVSNAFHDSTTRVKLTPGDPNPMADTGVLEGPPVVPNVHGEEAAVFPYGSLRNRFVVQFDAVLVGDRMNIRFFPNGQNPSATPFSPGITFFIRPGANPNAITLFNGAESFTPFNTGIVNTAQWNNYAFDVNIPANTIKLYVNQSSVGLLNLNTFAGGAFSTFLSGANVSLSAAAANETALFDNFQIGTPVPEPSCVVLALIFTAIVGGARSSLSLRNRFGK